MKKIAEKYRAFTEKERLLFELNRDAIAHINHNLLQWMLLIAAAISVVVAILSFVLDDYYPLRHTYVVLSALFALALYLQKKMPDSWVLAAFYGISLAMMSYAGYSSAILYPDSTGVLALGLVVVMPTLILDHSQRINTTGLAVLVGYLLFVVPKKLPYQHDDEQVYIICFTLVGLMMGSYLRRVRLENLELLSQSKIRETTDVLTGLYNRRRLFDYFIECEAGQAAQPVTALSILDIDFFKTYNDTYGHLAGDNCLKAVGACMLEYGKRHNMEFYRYGGEEFVAIAHETDAAQLKHGIEGILLSISALKIPHKGKKEGVVTVSQGVYLIPPRQKEPHEGEQEELNGFHAQQYLSQADEALYQAKQQGRNRTVWYELAE